MLTDLEKSILKILAFFDLSNKPLTVMEIYKWLDCGQTLGEVYESLPVMIEKNLLETQNGYYFLPGRQDLVPRRINSYVYSYHKLVRAKSLARILKFFPWVRAISIYGSLAFFDCKKDSDIDLFIVAEKGRLWSCRFFVLAFLKLFNLRPTKKYSNNRFCLSFFMADNNLNFKSVVNFPEDWHYITTLSQHYFIYDEASYLKKFVADNAWTNNEAPNIFFRMVNQRNSTKLIKIKKIVESLLLFVNEQFIKNQQLEYLPKIFSNQINQGTDAVINDQMIKLHRGDRRRIWPIKLAEKLNYIYGGKL